METLEFKGLSQEALSALAARLAPGLAAGDFLAFYGDLGAGKTTFIRALAAAMGIEDVSSPTFTIVREHSGYLPLFHFDAYRLSDADELFAIGFEDYLKRNGVIAMEWCENVPDALPAERLDIHISGSGEETRTVRFYAHAPRYCKALEAVRV